jgi:subtilisin
MSTSKHSAIVVLGSLLLYLSLSAGAWAADRSVIIGFHQPPGPAEHALIQGAKGKVKRTFRLIPAMAAKVPEQAVESLRRHPNVAYVEDDAVVSLIEPLAGGIEYNNAWGVTHIGSETAHVAGILGTGVKVAVIDTGIDYTHPDLDGNYQGGYDFVFDDNDPFDDSFNSHGTHVAGTIAAELNGFGVVGVAPEAWIYGVKVLDGAGFGLVSWLISGIEWVMINQMDVANISIGGPPSQALQEACDAAYQAGVLLVAAAGNESGGSVLYPAAYDSVIAVSATFMDDTSWLGSAVGDEVELAAPGVDINSTVSTVSSLFECLGHPCYGHLTGTSQASPHVAGTAALVLSSGFAEDLNGDGVVNNKDVRLQLRMTALDLGTPCVDPVYGYGLVSAAAVDSTPSPLICDHRVVTREKGTPADSAETVSLANAKFKITIINDSLSKIDVDVFDMDGSLLKELSESYRFGHKEPSEVISLLDATATTYNVNFVPNGKDDNSFADVYIQLLQP